jgi:hypothetical protein
MTEWTGAVTAYFGGEYRQSVAHLERAERLMPGFPDVQRLRADAQMRSNKNPRLLRRGKALGLGLGGVLVGILAVGGVRSVVKRRRDDTPRGVPRVSPEDLRRRLDVGVGVTLLDARRSVEFDPSPVQAAGALRYDVDRPDMEALRVQVNPDGEVVAYCG